MDIKTSARWLVIGGTLLTILGFFLPGIEISIKASSVIFEDAATTTIGNFTLADLAAEDNIFYLIPLCFMGTFVLNLLLHQSSVNTEQKKTIYSFQWLTSIVGLLFTIYALFYLNDSTSQITGLVDESLLGLFFSADIRMIPDTGIYLILIGFCAVILGLVNDKTSNTQLLYSPDGEKVYGKVRGAYTESAWDEVNDLGSDRIRDALPSNEMENITQNDASYENVYSAQESITSGRISPVTTAVERKKVQAWLVTRDGKNFQLYTGETIIGRSSRNDIQLDDLQISKQHAKIIEGNGSFQLVDLESTNGTWLNGHRITSPQKLHNEDVIRFGNRYEVQFASLG